MHVRLHLIWGSGIEFTFDDHHKLTVVGRRQSTFHDLDGLSEVTLKRKSKKVGTYTPLESNPKLRLAQGYDEGDFFQYWAVATTYFEQNYRIMEKSKAIKPEDLITLLSICRNNQRFARDKRRTKIGTL